MSRTNPSVREAESLQQACTVCEQPPTQWCRTPSGAWANALHLPRIVKRA